MATISTFLRPTATLGNTPKHECLSRDNLLVSRDVQDQIELNTSCGHPTGCLVQPAWRRIRQYERIVQLGRSKLAGVCKHKIGQRP